MTTEKKMTKAMMFEAVKEIVAASDVEEKAELVEFIDKQVEMLAAKAEKAKERAEKKRAESDELRATVHGVLTGEFQTTDAIVAKIGVADITKAKVTARLTQLINAGIAEKKQVKDGSRKVMAYKLADISRPVSEDEDAPNTNA
jgi:hypothetical protein